MSRSGYSEDINTWDLIRWRGAVNSALKGKRGQAFLKELLLALDDLAEKKLIDEELETNQGFCTLGALGHKKGLDLSKIDPYDGAQVSSLFDIAPALAREIVYMNDEGLYNPTPEQRFIFMRKWIVENIKQTN